MGGLEESSNRSGASVLTDERLWRSRLLRASLVGPAGSVACRVLEPFHDRHHGGVTIAGTARGGDGLWSQRGPLSPWLPVRGETPGLGSLPPRRAGSLFSVWTPVSCAACDREKGETLCGADTEVLPASLASRGLCVVFTVSRHRMQSGPLVARCYNGPLATFHRTSDVFLSCPPVEKGIERP